MGLRCRRPASRNSSSGHSGSTRRSRSLTRDGVRVSVGGRALDILLVLAAAAGETVGKAALFNKVWQGLTVEDNNLQVHMSALRKALGHGWIVTVPGRGYQLTAVAPRNRLPKRYWPGLRCRNDPPSPFCRSPI